MNECENSGFSCFVFAKIFRLSANVKSLKCSFDQITVVFPVL